MEYRQLGRSGLRVSTITLGTMGFGGRGASRAVGNTDVDGARRQIDAGRDAGVNLIDTADVYSRRLSEEIVGEALGARRDRVLLATKARMPMGDGPNDAGLSRHHLIDACEASLRRLATDHIDLYQVHEWDGQTPLEETLAALDTSSARGKVRYVGCSNYAGWQLDEGARRRRPRSASRASSASRSTTRCRPATPSTSSCPSRSTRGSASSSGARSPAACSPASTAAAQARPTGSRHLERLGRAAGLRPGAALRHRRRARRDRRGARRLGGAGSRSPGCSPARGHLADHRRAHRGAARRQPRRRRRSSSPPTTQARARRGQRRRCSTRSGTRRRPRATAWAPATSRCSASTPEAQRARASQPFVAEGAARVEALRQRGEVAQALVARGDAAPRGEEQLAPVRRAPRTARARPRCSRARRSTASWSRFQVKWRATVSRPYCGLIHSRSAATVRSSETCSSGATRRAERAARPRSPPRAWRRVDRYSDWISSPALGVKPIRKCGRRSDQGPGTPSCGVQLAGSSAEDRDGASTVAGARAEQLVRRRAPRRRAA